MDCIRYVSLSLNAAIKIKATPRRPRYFHNGCKESKIFANILNRKYKVDEPLRKVVTDITLLMNRGRRGYLSLFIDLFNNSIISLAYNSKQDNHLVIKPAIDVITKKNLLGSKSMLIHSDQGSQYASLGYTKLLESNNIKQSMSRAGNPRDNAVAESIIGHLKDVLYFDYDFRNSKDPNHTIQTAIKYFNQERPAYALKHKTPAQLDVEREIGF